jgi:S1-C subfamily serine protease
MKKFLSILTVFSVMNLVSPAAYALQPKAVKEVVKVVKLTATATIPNEMNPEAKPQQGQINASGVPINDSQILTAGHFCAFVAELVEKKNSDGNITISYIDGEKEGKIEGATVERYDFSDYQDLCLVSKEDHGLSPVKFNRSKVKIGQKVYAVGYPLGLFFNITEGYVTDPSVDDVMLTPLYGKILFSAPITGGNSGGVILDEKGKVVGITVMGIPMYHHLSFAVGVDKIREFLRNGE